MGNRFLVRNLHSLFPTPNSLLFLCVLCGLILSSCFYKNPPQNTDTPADVVPELSQFEIDLQNILQQDPYYYILVDKQNALSADYEPDDLVPLTGSGVSYRVNRNDLSLRRAAADALEEMAAAAKKEGLTLLASSTYRSYEYQKLVYDTWVRQLGREQADRVSARAGHSQHQLGTVVDFGSITNDFATTKEGIWIAANASRFGWSLSYPREYEEITGYSWESWHYRYVGVELAAFIDTYYDGIQQYALEYIHEYLYRD